MGEYSSVQPAVRFCYCFRVVLCAQLAKYHVGDCRLSFASDFKKTWRFREDGCCCFKGRTFVNLLSEEAALRIKGTSHISHILRHSWCTVKRA